MYLSLILFATIALTKSFEWRDKSSEAHRDFALSWSNSKDSVHFTVSAVTTGWIGIGFTDTPASMFPADMVIAWLDNKGACVVSNRHVGNVDPSVDFDLLYPSPDAVNYIKSCNGSFNNGVTTLSFIRPFTTGNSTDKVITNDTLNFSWATSDVKPLSINDKMTKHDEDSKGYSIINFFNGYSVPVYPKFTWTDANTKTRAFVATYQVDIAAGGVQFTVSAKTNGYIGIGFTESPASMFPANMTIVWLDSLTGDCYLSERTSAISNQTDPDIDSQITPIQDKDQDTNFSYCSGGTNDQGVVTISFLRPFKTSTPSDFIITNNNVNFIWATADFKPNTTDGSMIGMAHDADSRGYTVVNLFTGVQVPQYPKYTWCDPTSPLNFCLDYQVDIAAGGVQLTLKAKTSGYIGIGWAQDAGSMFPANMTIVWLDAVTQECFISQRTSILANPDEQDYDKIVADVTPVEDADQDTSFYLTGSNVDGVVSISFLRPFQTQTPSDFVISDSDFNFIWASNEKMHPNTSDGSMLGMYHGETSRGFTTLNFYKPPPSGPVPPSSQYYCDPTSTFCMYYGLNANSDAVEFDVVAQSVNGWVAIGFSNTPQSMNVADTIVAWVASDGTCVSSIRKNVDYVQPQIIPNGVGTPVCSVSGSTFKVHLSRPLSTGRSGDVVIAKESKTHFIFAVNNQVKPSSPEGPLVRHQLPGFIDLDFFSNQPPSPPASEVNWAYYAEIVASVFLACLIISGLIYSVLPESGYKFSIKEYRLFGSIGTSFEHNSVFRGLTLSRGEGVIALLYLTASIALIIMGYHDATTNLVDGINSPRGIAILLARFICFSLACTLLPVTRNSIWIPLFKISVERAIKWHRRCARITVLCVLIHGACMYISFGWDVVSSTEAYPPKSTVPLYGFIAGLAMLVMALSAFEYIRRNIFEMFWYPHSILIFVVVVAASLHNPLAFYLAIFPAALYVLDLALRIFTSIYGLKAETRAMPGLVSKVTLKSTDIVTKYQCGQYVFIRIPQISALQSHPFTISSADIDGNITFHIKSQGLNTFTGELFNLARQNLSVNILIEGPYGTLSIDPHQYQCLVLVAGGVGITPIAAILQDFVMFDRKKVTKVMVIWSCPSAAPFTSWFPELFTKTLSSKGVELHFYNTESSKSLKKSHQNYDLLEDQGEIDGEVTPILENISINKGRPNVKELIKNAKKKYASNNSDLGIITCGPPAMVADVENLAIDEGYAFHAETFEL